MSKTYLAVIVSFLTLGLPALGVQVADPDTLTAFLTQVVGVASVLFTFYARYKAGGITIFGLRKK